MIQLLLMFLMFFFSDGLVQPPTCSCVFLRQKRPLQLSNFSKERECDGPSLCSQACARLVWATLVLGTHLPLGGSWVRPSVFACGPGVGLREYWIAKTLLSMICMVKHVIAFDICTVHHPCQDLRFCSSNHVPFVILSPSTKTPGLATQTRSLFVPVFLPRPTA